MKRHLCLIVVLLVAVAMTACKSENRPSPPQNTSTSTSTINCAKKCAVNQIFGEDFKPDEVAPECKNINNKPEYQECIKGVVSKMVDACLTKCRAN